MNPDIVEKEVSIVVGIRSAWDLDPDVPGAILREKVLPRLDEICSTPGNDRTAIIVFAPIPDDAKGRYELVVGQVCDSLENIPPGMVGWELPCGVYAVVKTSGLLNVYPTYKDAVDRWLPGARYAPGSGLVVAQSPTIDQLEDPASVWRVNIQLRNLAEANPFGDWV
ncbi:MAG: GyrI-like domain-containing protein [Planctomycetota bacterium]|jgi:predicted transcriptional regulator YdeE|nr:GyrI-like domain-containing protein [Planctomycetota bacterium]